MNKQERAQNLGQEIATNTNITIGATSLLIDGKRLRKTYFFKNTSSGGQVITLCLANNGLAVAGSGLVLNPNDAIADSNTGDYKCWSGDIFGVASGAGATLAVFIAPED